MSLFKIQGFAPYLVILFLNAMTDIGHKIIIRNTIIKNFDGSEMTALIAVVNALILLPFILLLSPTGFLSDKYPKHLVIRYSAMASIVLAIFITISYFVGAFWLSFTFTFILATQSAIYSPAKYGYIKELVGKEQIATANGYVQAITIIAILFSSFLFSILFENLFVESKSISITLQNSVSLGFLLILFTIIETTLSFRLLQKSYKDDNLKFEFKKYVRFEYLQNTFGNVRKREPIWLSIIGLSLFWAIGQAIDSAFPTYFKEVLGSDNTVLVHGIMAVAGIGIVIGSFYAAKISKNYIELGSIPVSAIGITVVIFILPFTTSTYWLITLFFIFGFFGGLFIVPLNSLIQFNARDKDLGKVLATNNFVQNVAMLTLLVLVIAAAGYGIGSKAIFIIVGFIALGGAIYTIYKLPQSLLQYIILFIISRKYRLQVFGLDNLPSSGGVLLLGNHISWLDWAILQMATPRRIRFVMERSIYEKWYLKLFLDLFGVIPISSKGSKQSLLVVAQKLDEGEVVALFPEGHISRNGHLGEFHKGYELALANTKQDIKITPFFLRGLWGSAFSYASSKLRFDVKKFINRDVSVTFGKPMSKDTSIIELKKAIAELSITAWDKYSSTLKPIHISFLEQSKKDSNSLSIVELPSNQLTKTKVLTASILFSKEFEKRSSENNIGIILPSTPIGAIANMAILMLGKTVVNLNYTLGSEVLVSALKKAEIKTIYTSKKFISKLTAKGFDIEDTFKSVNVYFVEDIKAEIKKIDGFKTLLMAKLFPTCLLKWLYFKNVAMDKTASIIFSSGSEGVPKGIELTHKNIMGNIKQVIDILNPKNDDVVVGSLPIFHSFGFTVTTMMPLVEGITLATHPDPTDAPNIGKLVTKYRATMLFGTSTFFRLYIKNRKLNSLMFQSIRIVIAGAEKLKEDIKMGFKDKFGLEIYEGYGATETTPVASCNIPDVLNPDTYRVQVGTKQGTVGLPLPGTKFKIVDPNTLKELPTNEAGLILIGGTQIMKGYLKDKDKTNEVIVEIDNIRWYKSGDKGKVDEDGFLTIVDRYSRFAKIGGEMISLTAVEEALYQLFGEEIEVCASNIPDEKKGEKIVAMYAGELKIDEVAKRVLESDIDPLMAPSMYIKVEEIPKLGTGKLDFKGAKKQILEMLNK